MTVCPARLAATSSARPTTGSSTIRGRIVTCIPWIVVYVMNVKGHLTARAVLLVIIAVCLIVWGVFFALPAYIAPRADFATMGDTVHAQDEVRGLLFQAVGGIVLLVGAYVTWQQLQASREQLRQNMEATAAQLKATEDQLVIAHQAQITQRFAQAVDQLGSDQAVLRIGGIYALQRVTRDSPADADTIAEVLCSFVRQHAPLKAPEASVPERPPEGTRPPHDHLQQRNADVQAALSVLGRGIVTAESHDRLRLFGTDLRRANLSSASLAGADLEGADLRMSWMPAAQLQGADLTDADLRDAWLQRADLTGADLTGAVLDGSHMEGACLRGAILDRTSMRGATADAVTQWPDGFDPLQAGVSSTSGTAAEPG